MAGADGRRVTSRPPCSNALSPKERQFLRIRHANRTLPSSKRTQQCVKPSSFLMPAPDWQRPRRGGFNNTSNMAMLAHAVKHAVSAPKRHPAKWKTSCPAASRHPAMSRAGQRCSRAFPSRHRASRSTAPARRVSTPSPMRRAMSWMTARRSWSARRRLHHLSGRRRRRQGAEDRRDVQGLLDADDRHGGCGGRALQSQPRISGRIFARIPAAHGGGAAGRQVQGRDRSDGDEDESRQQGDEGRILRRLCGEPRRMQSSGHDHGRRFRSSSP